MEIKKAINTKPEPVPSATEDNDITPQEIKLLDNAGNNEEEVALQNASLDDTDGDGEALNESSFADARSGDDLDVPGAEEDDDNEALGEEDEENNTYSLGGDAND